MAKGNDPKKDDHLDEATLFKACVQLRGKVEPAEYKHLVLGLVFLKYISDSFETRQKTLNVMTRDPQSEWFTEEETQRNEILEDRDEYTSENVFWVPQDARWPVLLSKGSQPEIGVVLDKALDAIEKENPQLKGVLPKVFARAALQPETLAKLMTTIAAIGFGDDPDKARDVLGRCYEYFIKEFARAEGKRAGAFYTPTSVVRLIVEMLEPYRGRIFDPACGSCGMFIQSAKFISAHAGRTDDLAIYGQESEQATWRIGQMNLAIHGLSGEIKLGDSLLDDQHQNLKADYIIANPPFNQDEWGVETVAKDSRWKYGVPPDGNANYAWIQHFVSHLTPNGRAGFVLANGSLTTSMRGEAEIRQALLEDDLVDCIVALPGQLFFTSPIPVCVWFLDRDKGSKDERNRKGEVLFIDARQMGEKISRTQIDLTEPEVQTIVGTYLAWRSANGDTYEDKPGFARSATLHDIQDADWTLAPGRYVGAIKNEEGQGDFEDKMTELVGILREEMVENEALVEEVKGALGRVGYEL
jgi:type I restriction enzyme M protein